MTAFDRIREEIQASHAEEKTAAAILAAKEKAKLAIQVADAKRKFQDIGVHRFLREQAEAMSTAGYWNRYYEEGHDDRASASIGFVPAKDEPLDDHHSFGRMNEYSLIIQSYQGGDVHCHFHSRSHSEHFANNLPIETLTLQHVEGWFDEFLRKAFELRKVADEERARWV